MAETITNHQENLEICNNRVISDDYADFKIQLGAFEQTIPNDSQDYCIQTANQLYGILHANRAEIPPVSIQNYDYQAIPRLYTLLDTTSMDSSGITQVLDQPYLDLNGEGVLVGFIDTGIDYQNPLFLTESGESRIEAIWDQNIQGGRLPFDLSYGSEFTKIDIDAALKAENPLDFVPSTDENGHGTFMAGIAAGNTTIDRSFTGAAPGSAIAMVKLKPAKPYLREYYRIPENAAAYQDTDIILGVHYLSLLAERLSMPLVICIGLGSNSGDHTWQSIIARVLYIAGNTTGNCIVTAAGNEGASAHHYRGTINAEGESEDVEIRVAQNESGFVAELWADPSESFNISFISPTGEYILPASQHLDASETISFALERTTIEVNFGKIESDTGSTLVFMRFMDPTPGIWRIRVESVIRTTGIYHVWLPVTGFISPETIFLQPDPEMTLTSPAATLNAVSVSAYDHVSNGLAASSSRGFTRDGYVKPDIAAPGVNVYGPGLNNTFTRRSGSSVAAAHAAGAAADLLSWGIIRGFDEDLSSTNVRAYFIRGAQRSAGTIYPNREWGYGRLDLYNVFETLRVTI